MPDLLATDLSPSGLLIQLLLTLGRHKHTHTTSYHFVHIHTVTTQCKLQYMPLYIVFISNCTSCYMKNTPAQVAGDYHLGGICASWWQKNTTNASGRGGQVGAGCSNQNQLAQGHSLKF